MGVRRDYEAIKGRPVSTPAIPPSPPVSYYQVRSSQGGGRRRGLIRLVKGRRQGLPTARYSALEEAGRRWEGLP